METQRDRIVKEIRLLIENSDINYNRINMKDSTIKDRKSISKVFFESENKNFTLEELGEKINEKYAYEKITFNFNQGTKTNSIIEDNTQIIGITLLIKIDFGLFQFIQTYR